MYIKFNLKTLIFIFIFLTAIVLLSRYIDLNGLIDKGVKAFIDFIFSTITGA